MSWDGDVPGVPGAKIVTVRSLPARLQRAVRVGPHSQARPGALLRIVPGTARYLVTGGTTIAVAEEPGADPADVESYLHGGVRGALIHQRGELALHASTVVPPGRHFAVAITGASGAGKSSLAAELVLRGWSLLSDDLTRVTVSNGEVLAWSGRPVIKLAGDSCGRLGIGTAGLRPASSSDPKLIVPVALYPAPVRLGLVVEVQRERPLAIENIDGTGRLLLLAEQTFRPHYVAALGCQQDYFHVLARVASFCPFARVRGRDPLISLAERLDTDASL